jgi:hypothetical protein
MSRPLGHPLSPVVARLKADMTTVTRYATVELAGAEPTKHEYGSRIFDPQKLSVTWVNGKISSACISGPAFKKDGTLGRNEGSVSWWGADRLPEWVAGIIRNLEVDPES